MRNFVSSWALAIVLVAVGAAGCGRIGEDEKTRIVCDAGTVYNPVTGICDPVQPDAGVARDSDGDGFADPDDCRPNDRQVHGGLTVLQKAELCRSRAYDQVDVDCDGVVDCRAACYDDLDCRDDDSDTLDRCVEGECAHEPREPRVECDDGIACTEDVREDGGCRFIPVDASCGPEFRCVAGAGCIAREERPGACRGDADCDDGRFCNGVERCVVRDGRALCEAGSPPSCDDAVACTEDRCDDLFGCFALPRNDRCAGGHVCDPFEGRCRFIGSCRSDAECSDSNACTGEERCVDFTCVRVTPPVSCDDGDPLTVDGCDAASGACIHRSTGCLSDAQCSDGNACDGAERCVVRRDGSTCVEGTPIVCEDEPGLEAECRAADGACILRERDRECVPGTSRDCMTGCGSAGRQRCKDDGTFGACQAPSEACNGSDDDCDGLTDEGCVGPCVPQAEVCDNRDNDCDSVVDNMGMNSCGVGACSRTVNRCVAGVPQTCTPGTPSASETCSNGVDDDCDGSVDEGCGMVVVPGVRRLRVAIGSSLANECLSGYEFCYWDPGGAFFCAPRGNDVTVDLPGSWSGFLATTLRCGASNRVTYTRCATARAEGYTVLTLDGSDLLDTVRSRDTFGPPARPYVPLDAASRSASCP